MRGWIPAVGTVAVVASAFAALPALPAAADVAQPAFFDTAWSPLDLGGDNIPTSVLHCPSGSYTVPAGVTQITITAIGGHGAPGSPSSPDPTGKVPFVPKTGGGTGGRGARITTTVPVAPGQVLNVVVATDAGSPSSSDDMNWAPAGGWGGGGVSANGDDPVSGGGGGASYVTTASLIDDVAAGVGSRDIDNFASTSCKPSSVWNNVNKPPFNQSFQDTADMLVVAAGGGGGGNASAFGNGGNGGDAGMPGGNGADGGPGTGGSSGGGGDGGTQTSGGLTGNIALCDQLRFGGSFLAGGFAGVDSFTQEGSGAGGSGLFGGGSGARSCVSTGAGGGGGGSSYVRPGATNTSSVLDETLHPSVTITPVLVSTSTALSASATQVATGHSVTFTATVSPVPSGGSVDFSAADGTTTTDLGSSPVDTSTGVATLAPTVAAGKWTVTAHYLGSTPYTESTSSGKSLQVGTAPSVTTDPTDVTVLLNNTATFTAAASGDPAPTVMWQESFNSGANWSPIGTTSTTLNVVATDIQFNGVQYRAVFSNADGSAASAGATLTIQGGPKVFLVAPNNIALAGTGVSWQAVGIGNPIPDATWQTSTNGVTWTDISPTDPSFSISFATVPSNFKADAFMSFEATMGLQFHQFRVKFTNSVATAVTAPVTLHVLPMPSCIVLNPTPTNFAHCHGVDFSTQFLEELPGAFGDFSDANFTHADLKQAFFGSGNLEGANLSGVNALAAGFGTVFNTIGGDLRGADLSNGNFTFADFHDTDLTGANLSGADFTSAGVIGANFTHTQAAPADVTLYESGPVSPSVVWDPPVGVTGLSLQDCSVGPEWDDGANFASCVILGSNINGGFPASATLTITLVPPGAPVVTTQPSDATVQYEPSPYSAQFTAAASGAPPPTVQWQSSTDGGHTFTDMAGETSPTLVVDSPPVSADGTEYQAVFTNSQGTVTSNPATLHVEPATLVVAVEGSQTFGGNPAFSVLFAITPPGVTLSGAPACTAVLAPLSATDMPITSALTAGSYSLDGDFCSGMDSSDPTDYTLRYVGFLGSFVVLPVTINVHVGGTMSLGGLPNFTEVDNAPAGIHVGQVGCSQLSDGSPLSPVTPVGTYTLLGSSCSGPPLADPVDYKLVYEGAFNGFTVNPAAIHVNVSGFQVYGDSSPTFFEADDAAAYGDTLSGTLTCTGVATTTTPVGVSPLPGKDCGGLTASDPAVPVDYVDGTFQVVPAPVDVVADNQPMVYGHALPSFSAHIVGLVNDDPPTVFTGTTCSAPTAGATPGVGTYPIACTPGTAANYYVVGTSPATLTVNPAPATVVADGQTMGYGTSVPALTDHVTGLLNDDQPSVVSDTSCVSSAGAHPAVGTYTGAITCSGGTATNYTLGYQAGDLQVTPATLTVTAHDKSMVYGGPVPVFDAGVDGLANGDTFTSLGGSCGDAAATTTLAVGTYSGAITCSGVDPTNYSVTYHSGTLKVTQHPLTLTADDAMMTYGGSLPTFTYQLDGLVNNEPPTVVSGVSCSAPTAGTAPVVGPYAIGCSGGTATNYSITGYDPGTLHVQPAIATVVADGKEMTYGTPVPALTDHVTGLVNNDGQSVVSGVSCLSSAGAQPAAGTYAGAITCSGGSATNYTLHYQVGTLQVDRAPLSVTAKAKTMTYGGPVPAFDATVVGLANGDTFTSLGGSCGDAAASVTLAAGTYTGAISCSGVNPANYDVAYYPGTLTVNREPVSVTAKPASMTYGGTVPAFDANVSGLVNGDTFTGLGGSCNDAAASATLAAGTYTNAITCSGVNPANYDVAYYPGTLTVHPADLTVTADNQTATYGYTLPALTYHVTGFVNGQSPTTSGVGGLANCLTTATPTSPSGPYPITCTVGSLTAANYDFPAGNFVNGTLTLGKHGATVGYTGGQFFATATSSATSASVTLQALVVPSSGGTVDLTKAQVSFLLYKSGNLTMVTPDATCVAPSVSSTGVATCTVSALAVDNWTVVPVIPGSNQYFSAPAGDPAIVTVYQPTTGPWSTGGGWVSDPGATVSPANRHGNFGYNVRYGSNNSPKGQAVFAFRGSDGYDYVVKSNSWQGGGLSFSTKGTGFSGKCSVIVIDPTTGLQVSGLGGGNYSFRVDATDNGTTGDTYAISVYTSTGALWHQAGTTATQLLLGGGNIVVHSK